MFDGPHLKQIRQAVGCTQLEFSKKYGIPIGTLRNWEQDRVAPDSTSETLLYLIATAPEQIAELLKDRPPLSD